MGESSRLSGRQPVSKHFSASQTALSTRAITNSSEHFLSRDYDGENGWLWIKTILEHTSGSYLSFEVQSLEKRLNLEFLPNCTPTHLAVSVAIKRLLHSQRIQENDLSINTKHCHDKMGDAPKSGPSTAPGERLANYFDNFFKTIVGISTLGASITFNRIVSSPFSLPHDHGISPNRALYLLGVSWLFFVIALAVTSFFASALSLWRPLAIQTFGIAKGPERDKVLWFATAVSALLIGLIVVAFLTLSLVIVAFTGSIGWVAVTFVTIFAILCLGTIIWRSPLQWPSWVTRAEKREMDKFDDYLRKPTKRGERREKEVRIESGGAQGHDTNQGAVQQEPKDDEAAYGRTTSGDYRSGGSVRYGRREDSYNVGRYSKASTITSDAYEPGMFGQGGFIYDDGVREGLVMSRYPQ